MKKKDQAALADRPNKIAKHGNNTTTLPESITERVQLVLNDGLSPQKDRLVRYVVNHPDSWTHQLAANCAVGFPPNRIGELNKEILPHYGLHILCKKPEQWLKNRHGDTSYAHQWRLVKIPAKGVAA